MSVSRGRQDNQAFRCWGGFTVFAPGLQVVPRRDGQLEIVASRGVERSVSGIPESTSVIRFSHVEQ